MICIEYVHHNPSHDESLGWTVILKCFYHNKLKSQYFICYPRDLPNVGHHGLTPAPFLTPEPKANRAGSAGHCTEGKLKQDLSRTAYSKASTPEGRRAHRRGWYEPANLTQPRRLARPSMCSELHP